MTDEEGRNQMTQFATLRNFTKGVEKGSPEELKSGLEHIVEALTGTGEKGTVQVRIVGEKEPRYAHFKITPKLCELQNKKVEKPDVELIAREETALSILDGSLSPIEAFLHGKMRFRGNAALGKRLLRMLASSPDAQIDICKIGV